MSLDPLDLAYQQSYNPVPVKSTISRDEAIAALKKHHNYDPDPIEDAHLRSVDSWEPTQEEIEALRKRLEGVSDREIVQAINEYMEQINSLGNPSNINSKAERINADAERRRQELLDEGVSPVDAERRIAFYIEARQRLEGMQQE